MRTVPLTPQISLNELSSGKTDFAAHYSALNRQGTFAPEIKIDWISFQQAIEVNGGVTNNTEIALRFIHRFDNTGWFLTMEVCQMNLQTGEITAQGNRFDLKDGSLTQSNFQGMFDPAYFANVLYDNSAISQTTYVNNILFPWYQQISEMRCQNSLPANDANVFVKFASVTYDATNTGRSLVQYPHTIYIFMNATGHGDYVDNVIYTQMFVNKAANYGTVCPPKCSSYEWPQSLPLVPICLK